MSGRGGSVNPKVRLSQQNDSTINQNNTTIHQNYSTIIFFRQFDINNSTITFFSTINHNNLTNSKTFKHLYCFRQFIITVQHEAKLFNNVMKNRQH